MALHQAEMLPEWGDVTFLTSGTVPLDETRRAGLEARGVTIEETPPARLEGIADVVLNDGRRLAFAGIFTTSHTRPASPVARSAGCALTETPHGTLITTDETKMTTVPGIYACGDVAAWAHSLALAVGDGAMAGTQIHRSLIWPDM